MKSFGKVLTIAMLAAGCGLVTAPKASACPNVLTQPAVIDSSVAPVIDNSLVQPGVIGNTLSSPAIIDNSLMQSGMLDTSFSGCGTPVLNSCSSCASPVVNTTLMQPAVIDSGCGLGTCGVGGIGGYGGYGGLGYGDYGFRRHFLGLDTPFFGFHLF